MKHLASVALLIPLAGCMSVAQVPPADPPPATVYTTAAPVTAPLFTLEQLDQLLAPIALYPDAMVALILPASTNPSDIVLAARFLQSGGLSSQADTQPWEDSVRALAHYPQVVRWMDENLAWTKQLGDAFEAQPSDVMNAVQRLRARARATGALANTAQQQVIYQEETILIVPTDPNLIYIPYYDPNLVYDLNRGYTSYVPGSFFSFSTGFATGWWLSYGLDWPSRRVWSVNHSERERYWREHQRDWHRYDAPHRPDHDREVHVWYPRNDRWQRPNDRPTRPGGPTYATRPMPTPDSRHTSRPDSDDHRGIGGRHGTPTAPTETAVVRPGLTPTPAAPTVDNTIPSNVRRDTNPRGWHREPASQGNPSLDTRVHTLPAPATTPNVPPVPAPAWGRPGRERPNDRGSDHRPAQVPTPAPMPTVTSPIPAPGYSSNRPAPPAYTPSVTPPPTRQPEHRSAPPPTYTPPPPAPTQNTTDQPSNDSKEDTPRKRPPYIRPR